MTAPAVAVPETLATVAEAEEKAKLRKHFGRFDIFFFLICTIVGLDTLGAVSSYGAQAFVWLAFMSFFFFLPYAMLTAELGSTFREEGGPYVWVKLAMGRLPASINSVLYWLSNPIWLGGALTITAYSVFTQFFYDPAAHLSSTGILAVQILFGVIFIWIATWSAILSFGIGKWIPTIGAWVRVLLLSAFTLTVVLYAIKHGVHGVSGGDFKPTSTIFFAAVPVLFFNFVGFELPCSAGDEMKNPKRDVPHTIARAWLVAVLAYGIPVLAILLVLPAAQITSLGGFVDAIKTVFTVYGGSVVQHSDGTVAANLTGLGSVLGGLAAIGFIWALLSSGATWIMGADRAEAVACYDGGGPRWLGVFSKKYGTPIAVNFASGAISTVVMVLAFKLSGSAQTYFSAVLGLAISTTTLSYLFIFPSLYLLRRKHASVERPYSVPFGNGGALAISLLTTLWSLLASIALVWPGFFDAFTGGTPDDSLPDGFAGRRGVYELTQFLPLAAIVLLAVVFYALGAKTRRQTVVMPTPAKAQPAT
ncbi:MAG: glutamate:GABA antiporter [Nocardioidaceae bacterium]|jgi:amino acid transporter|nr:glutamate:GABA antiporter [Nocardioidaceae bacterium]